VLSRTHRSFRCALNLCCGFGIATGIASRAAAQAQSDPGAAVAPAQPASSAPAPSTASPEAPTPAAAPAPALPAPAASDAATAARLEALARQNEDLSARIEELESEQQWTSERVDQLLPLKTRLTGYIDFGFFYVQGDGRGIRSDLGHEHLPEYADVPDSWVFLGDPLSTAINSRGDPADVAESRAIVFDPIGNGGEPSFILNALNFQLFSGVGDDVTVNASFDLLPRARNISDPDGDALGDFVDVKLAYADYRLELGSTFLTLYAGKFDSVVGYEYRVQESTARISVTPSLVCRYVCGHPLGLKARWQLFSDLLVLNAALTNGSHFSESFDFADETDVNAGKTIAGRVSSVLPLGAGLELGVSGAYGTQDAQSEEEPKQWHLGADLHLELGDLNFSAEVVQGEAEGLDVPGDPACAAAPCIEYVAGYALGGYRVTNWLMPYARSDFRDALHRSGASFVYHSELVRVTGGVRFDLGTSVIVKAEYTLNRELGPIPEFENDVFTSSLVTRW